MTWPETRPITPRHWSAFDEPTPAIPILNTSDKPPASGLDKPVDAGRGLGPPGIARHAGRRLHLRRSAGRVLCPGVEDRRHGPRPVGPRDGAAASAGGENGGEKGAGSLLLRV